MNIIPNKTLAQVLKKDENGKTKVLHSGIVTHVSCISSTPAYVKIFNHKLKGGEYQTQEWFAISSKNIWTEFTGELQKKDLMDMQQGL